ncbi:MAG TPA: hypothetical protein VGL53_09080 [Bryobacteraceae bacterium]
MSELAEIRALQFTDLPRANALLIELFRAKLPFPIRSVQIRPLAVSLNSVNGFLETDERKLFFKAHIESQVAGREYYNTEVLADAGYPILKPVLKASESAAQHVMLYEIVESPTMFDACRALEQGTASNFDALVAAQQKSDRQLLALYRRSLHWASAADNAQSPIHQLFYHRLTGGRYAEFYLGSTVQFPGIEIPFEDLARMHWTINGVTHPHTLAELVDRAIELLNPAKSGPAIAGHGDAHNGNLFYIAETGDLLYFDPAFAGHHSPLLDLVKPLYHNVHAQWMYFPEETSAKLSTSVRIADGAIHVEHDFSPTPIRTATHDSKTNLVLRPLVEILKEKDWLDAEWKAYMQSALLCCPLLTMNLCDHAKFPPSVSLLGFAHTIAMGDS